MQLPVKSSAPRGLSPWARRTWKELTARHAFEAHEVVTFTRALRWFDCSDALMAQAERATEREKAALLKQAMDSANTGLRHWRALKWPAPDGVRRPGRPAGANWSPARKAVASA